MEMKINCTKCKKEIDENAALMSDLFLCESCWKDFCYKLGNIFSEASKRILENAKINDNIR
jgi:hypothetical protein